MTARNAIMFMLFLALALASWYLARSLQPSEVTETVSDGSGDGFYLKSARILGTDANGALLYEIAADYVEQQQNNDITMENVQVSYSAGSEVPWTMVADSATISENQRLLHLSGNVKAVSSEGFAGEVTEIRTQQLYIEPDAYKAETNSRVQIRIGSRSLTAIGMLALLRDNRLQLKSNVNGKFVP